MNRKAKPSQSRDPERTRNALIAAAQTAFNTHGYFGTDSNRIAREAGYAPQTFYRHFADKTEIFLAVYDRWWRDESAALEPALRGRTGKPDANAAAKIVIGFHTRWRVFRRSLRHLAIEDARVRAARNNARTAQIARMRGATGSKRGDAEMLVALLTAERLCDAAAEGEFHDLKVPPPRVRELVAQAMETLMAPR